MGPFDKDLMEVDISGARAREQAIIAGSVQSRELLKQKFGLPQASIDSLQRAEAEAVTRSTFANLGKERR